MATTDERVRWRPLAGRACCTFDTARDDPCDLAFSEAVTQLLDESAELPRANPPKRGTSSTGHRIEYCRAGSESPGSRRSSRGLGGEPWRWQFGRMAGSP